MTLLITGSRSFVGQELIAQCRAGGIEYVGIDVSASGPGLISGDIRDPGLVRKLPDNIETVVHLAAISRDSDCRSDPASCYAVNVAGTINVFAAAQARGAKQFVFASSEWVYDSFVSDRSKTEENRIDPGGLTSDYALSKLMAEQALRLRQIESGMAVTVLRFGIIYGPRRENFSAVETLFTQVAAGRDVVVGSQQTARCFIHVSDIARGILASLGRAGFDIFNIQGRSPVTLGEVVAASGMLLGCSPNIIETNSETPSIRNVSGEKAARVLGFVPVIGLMDGLASVAEFLELGGLARRRAT